MRHHRVYVVSDAYFLSANDLPRVNGLPSVSVKVGDYLDLVLVSDEYEWSGGTNVGRLVPWMTPFSSNMSVIAHTDLPAPRSCPAKSTCTPFEALSPGAAVITAPGPSGGLCHRASGQWSCGAVSAVELRFSVEVSA